MAADELAELGSILRNARKQAGLSTRQLAKEVGVHHSYIGHIENGLKTNPAAELLQKLADVLGLDANEHRFATVQHVAFSAFILSAQVRRQRGRSRSARQAGGTST